MQAFLDESGTNPELPILTVAGCYGEQDQWTEFRRMWEPHSAKFHAKNCSPLFSAIVSAMAGADIHAMLVSVRKAGFKQSASPHFKTALGNEYASCALLCVAKICDEITPKKSSFVLEAGQPNVGFVKQILESMMDTGEWGISSVASAQKAEFIELQSADFVSHIASTYDRPWMQELFDLRLLKHVHVTQEHLENTSPILKDLFQKVRAIRRAIKKKR